jgi:hypothetical protein
MARSRLKKPRVKPPRRRPGGGGKGPREGAGARDKQQAMLELLTGHWLSQLIFVTAQLGVADAA